MCGGGASSVPDASSLHLEQHRVQKMGCSCGGGVTPCTLEASSLHLLGNNLDAQGGVCHTRGTSIINTRGVFILASKQKVVSKFFLLRRISLSLSGCGRVLFVLSETFSNTTKKMTCIPSC